MAGVAAGAGNVLGDDLLAEGFRQSLRHHARDHVGRTAGPERHDQADLAARIALRRCAIAKRERCANHRCNGAQKAENRRHGILP
jgi:hypothetical protein